jgi:hypothetical protein
MSILNRPVLIRISYTQKLSNGVITVKSLSLRDIADSCGLEILPPEEFVSGIKGLLNIEMGALLISSIRLR